MKRLLSFLLAACLCLCGCGVSNGDAVLKSSQALDMDSAGLDTLAAYAAFEHWDDYQVYFTGETHASQKNYHAHRFFLEFFHQNYGVQHLLVEGGFCSTQLLNHYINSGDEDTLAFVMENLEGTASYSQEEADFYRGLYKYQQALPTEEKLLFVGIDVEHQFSTTGFQYLFGLAHARAVMPRALKKAVEYFNTSKAPDEEEIILLLKDIEKEQKQKPGEYESFFGDDLFDFSFALSNILQGSHYYDKENKDAETYREQSIMDNFDALYKHYDRPAFFGQFGAYHSDRSPKSFTIASFLDREYEETKGRVLSIAYLYQNCYLADRHKDYRPQKIKNSALSQFLAKEYPQTSLIVKLAEGEKYGWRQEEFAGHQYGFLLQDSPAITPFESQ